MEWIDIRSDTVTRPTPAMWDAMSSAEVGDDVYGEDPTVNRLQKEAAVRMGKEGALFVPSGTMGNIAAILAHCQRGDEIIIGDRAHTYIFEAGGTAALGGIHPRVVPNEPDGTIQPEAIVGAIRSEDAHFPESRLVCLENTHNLCGGTPIDVAYTEQVAEIAHSAGLKLHIDGARIFNAAVALNVKSADLVREADSVTFCLSKGLCAPVGSVICGDEDFIRRAHRMRKQLGGGMRQAGVIAAAGLVALDQMIDRLAEDHRKAKELAVELTKIDWLVLENAAPATNMIFFRLAEQTPITENELVQGLRSHRIRIGHPRVGRFRIVTHYWVDDSALESILTAFQSLAA